MDAPAGENASELKVKKSAWDDFQGMVNQDCYVWAKELMSASEEGLLKDYTFEEDIGEGRTPTTLMSLRSRGGEFEVAEVADSLVYHHRSWEAFFFSQTQVLALSS